MLPEDNNSLSLKEFKMTICQVMEFLLGEKILSKLSSLDFLYPFFLLSTHLYDTLHWQLHIMVVIYPIISWWE